ncbi:hypothetical protein [Breoghania sp.]|uniref:hypothetical protein n=1 Tax=Breoghania sp. TaxID=2065378 RepID=UPI002620ADCC|nr:hypothetical protein [Breoghania sp.]
MNGLEGKEETVGNPLRQKLVSFGNRTFDRHAADRDGDIVRYAAADADLHAVEGVESRQRLALGERLARTVGEYGLEPSPRHILWR